jgi:hypothetical protein
MAINSDGIVNAKARVILPRCIASRDEKYNSPFEE